MAYLGLPQEKSALPSSEFPTETTSSYEITPEKEAQLQDLQAERQQQQEARSLIVEPTDYTKLSGQQNRGIAKGVQMVVGDSSELYSVPATTKEDLFARGFLDNSGEPTSKGRLAVTLIKKGVLNPDFTLSENGRLFNKKEGDFFTQDNAEAQSTYQSYFEADPDRYNKMLEWKKAKELGLFDEESDMAKEKSFSDTAVEKGKGLLGMVSNAGKMLQAAARVAVGSELPFMDVAGLESPEVEAKIRTRIAGGEEGFVEMAGQSFMNQSAWINKGVNAVLEKTGVLTKEQADAQNTFNEYKAASFKDFYKKTDTVAELSSAIGLDDAANQLAASEQLLGKEQFGKIKAEGAEVGAFLGDITNIEISPLMKMFGAVAGGGSKLLDSVVNANRIKEVKKITAFTAESSLYEARTAEAASKVQLFTGEAGRANELKRFATTAGDTEQAIAHSVNEASWARQAAEATAQAERNAAMSQTLRETANGLENSLPPTFQSQIINAGKLPVALPLKAVGFAAKKFGDTLASVDRGASSFLETFGLDKYRGLARAASIFTGNVNPLSIAEGVVASNKLWNGAGRLLDSLGENMLVNQGTSPFFRRVADDMATPWGKTFATQLDNFVPPVARGVGAISKGIAGAAAPSLVYEAINHQGLDANVFKQAATDALVFGGVHGVFKAATVGGARDFNAVKAGDRANFNERLKNADPEQYDIYNSKVDPSTKDLISSFSGAYPNAKIKFVTEGPSYQTGSTATFNVNAPREHAGVIALHELKHVLQNEFQLDEAILAHMVGNKTRGGEIFTKDGSLDPEFVKFSNEYNNRIKALGQPELGVHDLAIEFYTDKAAEVLKSDIKSGEFTKRAQESQLSRTVKSHFSSLVNQVPIIKNIHIKTGGAIDSSGRLVKGSGLLSEGFTQSKDVQAMVRKLYRETAGVSKPVVSVAQEGAAMRQPRATKSTREGINNGTSAIEKVNRDSRAAGLEVPEGALDPSTVRGRDGVPTALQTKAIIDSGAIHPDHLGTFPMLVGEMNPSSTSTFLFHYRPAEQGRTTQSAAGETFHHIKPVGVRTNKKGNVLITALDVNLWDQNIKKVASSKPAKDLGYTEKQIRADSYEASKYHIKNQSPDAYFEQKYGKAQALKRKSLVASTYGEMTAKQRAYNPLLSEVGMGRPDHVYRTFSLDDVKSATRTNSSVNLSFDPNNYYSLKVNLMPEAPIVDRSGNIIENPAMKDFFENHLPNGQRFRENLATPESTIGSAPTSMVPQTTSRYMPESTKQQISMPDSVPAISKSQTRFLPEPIEKLASFAGKRVQVLTSDLSIVKDITHGEHTAKFKGGPGYLDNDGWAFTAKDAADAFVTRWKKDGKPLIGLASLGPANHLNSLDARKAYGEKWKSLVDSNVLSEQEVSSHIQKAMGRIAESDAKSVKPAWKEVASKIKNANDLAEYFDKIPWAAAPMFYNKLTAKTLPVSYKTLVKHGLDLESAAKEYRQPEFHKSELGDLYAIAEYDGSAPDYKPELNTAYPWRIKFFKRATLSEMHNVADLTTDPRAFAGKKVGGRLGAQPLMVTGINLDRLMAGDLKASGKPLTMHPETARTKSHPAEEFGSGNPSEYQPYSETPLEKPIKKSKSTVKVKTSPESISSVAKMK
jgi:hypothetical protein